MYQGLEVYPKHLKQKIVKYLKQQQGLNMKKQAPSHI